MRFKVLLVGLFLSLCTYAQTTGPGTTGGGTALSTNIVAPTDNQGLCYQTSSGLWINGSCASGTATSVPASGVTAGALGTGVTLTNLSQLPAQSPGTIVGVPPNNSTGAPSANPGVYGTSIFAADPPFNVVCNGSTDQTTNLQTFFTYVAASYGSGVLPTGGCVFSSTLTIPLNFRSLLGAGQYNTKLLYTGASTGIDLIQIEGSASNSIIGNAILGGFSVSSHTQMQGGDAIHLKWVSGLTLRDINLADQNCSAYTTNCDWLWNGITDESTGLLFIDNYNIQTQNDCIQVFGVGAGGSGPQYDTYIGKGKLAGCKGASGAASSGSTTTIVDTNQNWITNNYTGQTVSVVVGGTTYTATISSNTSTTLTFPAIGAAVVATDPYAVVGSIGAGLHVGGGFDNVQIAGPGTIAQNGINVLDDNALVGIGNATGGSTTTLIDTSKNWKVNDYVGLVLTVTISATPYTATVTANTSNTMTFAAIGTAVTAASPYSIAGFGSAKNQRITIGPNLVIDSATGTDNIYINDPFANSTNWDDIRISAQITGSKQGNGINVNSYPSGYIHLTNAMVQANKLSGLYVNDLTTHILVDAGSTISYNSQYGVQTVGVAPYINSLAYVASNTIGQYSLASGFSVIIGGQSSSLTGDYNYGIGMLGMGTINNVATTASSNVWGGYEALEACGTCTNSVVFGHQAAPLYNSTALTAIGFNVAAVLTSGNGTFIGRQVGSTTTTGTADLVLGTSSNCVTTGAGTSNEIDICAGGAAESLRITGANTPTTSAASFAGTLGLPSITTGTAADFSCFTSAGVFIEQTTPCIGSYASSLSIPTGTATFAVGSGVTSVACASGFSCNNTRGTLTIVGGTATTGTIATVSFSAALSAAPACFAIMNGGATAFGIGNSAPTTTAFNITSAVSVAAATFNVNYQCQP